jgi:hypothetical protein
MCSVWHNDVAVGRWMGVELAPITLDSSELIKNEKEKEKRKSLKERPYSTAIDTQQHRRDGEPDPQK